MRYRSIFCILLSAALAASCASSNKSSSLANSANIVSDVQEFDVDGVHVLLRSSGTVPVVSAILFIKGGLGKSPVNEPSGINYFAMNIATASGSQRISKSYYRRKLVRMGSGIGGQSGRDYCDVSMQCTRENFDTTWSYFTDVIMRPAFDTVEYDNFNRSVLLNLRSITIDPESYSNHLLDSVYFAGTPYGQMMTSEDVERISIEGVRTHYLGLMEKSRFLLVVVGNVSREEITDKIESSFAKLPEGTSTTAAIAPPKKAFSPGAYFPPFDRKLPTDYILAYYLMPSKGDSDYYPYLRLRNFFGGFVFNHIRVQHNLAYAPNVDEKEGRVSIGTISLQTPYVDSAVRIIYEDVDFFQNNHIRESAIREGVAGWATRNYLKVETTASQAALLGQAKLETGDWHDAFFAYDKLARVTPDQLVAVAKKYLRNFNWIVVGDTSNVDRKLLESR
jgi:predicted Zn-dependent peptidase